MEKIIIKLDVSKIDKSKIVTKTFTTKTGETVTKKVLDLEIVPLKGTRLVKDGDTYQLLKTHFVAETQTKEERANKIKSKIIGEGLMFKNKVVQKVEEDIMPETEQIDDSEIPF